MIAHKDKNSAVEPESLARYPVPCSFLSGKALDAIKEAASNGDLLQDINVHERNQTGFHLIVEFLIKSATKELEVKFIGHMQPH